MHQVWSDFNIMPLKLGETFSTLWSCSYRTVLIWYMTWMPFTSG